MTPFLPFLSLHLPPHFHTYLPLNDIFFFSFFPSVSLSPSCVRSTVFFCPFSPFSFVENLIILLIWSPTAANVTLNAGLAELIPNFPQYSFKQLPNLGVYNTTGPPSLFSSSPPMISNCRALLYDNASVWACAIHHCLQ